MPTLHCQDLSTAVNMNMNTVVTIPTPSSLQVKSGNSNCTIENLKELANKCHNIRLSTMVDEAYRLSKMIDEAYNTTQALLGDCIAPARDVCGWLQRILVLEGCNKFTWTTVLQPPFVLRE